MSKTIGVTLSDGIVAGLVVDHKLEGGLRRFPDNEEDRDALVELHTDALVETICKEVVLAANGHKDLDAVGVAVPGLIKSGVVEEAPNLPQLKGATAAGSGGVAAAEPRHQCAGSGDERCGCDGCGAGFGAWEAGQHDSRVDAGRGDWVWAVSVYEGRVGGWPLDCDAG